MKSRAGHSLWLSISRSALCCLFTGLFINPIWGDSSCMAADSADAVKPVAAITIQTRVVVSDKQLKLLDFCEPASLPEEWRALLADADLGPAPKAGQETEFSAQQIVHHLQRLFIGQGMDPKQIKIQIPDKITVARQQISITREQIEAIYREFIEKKACWKAEDLVIRQISFSDIPALPYGILSYEVTASPHELFVGDVTVTIRFHVNGKAARNMRVSGKVDLFQEVAHTVRSMKRSELINDADIQFLRINVAPHPDRYVMKQQQIAGKKLLSDLGPNQPFRPRDLENPALVKRGDPVTIVFQEDGIRMSTSGEARENGGQGDRIQIINADSRKRIFCQVIDAQTVAVLP